MDRRKFLQQVSLWSAGIILTPPVFDLTAEASANRKTNPDIIVIKGKAYDTMVEQVVEKMGGIQAFVKSGDRVVIKPNIGWDRNVEQAANTNPAVVSKLAQLCLDAGASKVLVFDRTCNEKRRCYANSGIQQAIKQIKDKRIKLSHIDKRKFVPVTIEGGTALDQWTFYKDALEADTYINVPVAKHHGSSGLSIGLKNTMGVIGGARGKLHWQLGEKIADLNRVIQSSCTIVDATRVLTRNGPQGGSLSDVKQLDTIVGSKDPVAVDAYSTTLFGLEPDEIDSTVFAHKAGLGQMNLDQCNIQEFII